MRLSGFQTKRKEQRCPVKDDPHETARAAEGSGSSLAHVPQRRCSWSQ